jgi:hypothetical protein
MTEYCPISGDEYYAKGWRVRAGYWHNGTCPGASAGLGRAPSGMCSAALANIRNEEMRKAMDNLMGDLLWLPFRNGSRDEKVSRGKGSIRRLLRSRDYSIDPR